MSFRVKPTSKFLKQPEEKVVQKESLFITQEEKKKNRPVQSTPKEGSVSGLAIRSVVVAQPDHF